jgi:nucleotide-binding universal stress UspA family protein
LGLVDWVKEHQDEFEWVIVTSNGYRGEITKMRFVGSTTSKILEEVDCNLFLLKE